MVDARRDDPWLPFASAFDPWRQRFGGEVHLPADRWAVTAVADLASALVAQLATVGGRALLQWYAERHADRAAGSYETFVAHVATRAGRAELAARWPVLAAALERLTDQWIDVCRELDTLVADHACDLARLAGVAGPLPAIVEVRAPLGDRHAGGRVTMGLRAEQGEPIVYKPRSLGAEGALWEVFADLIGERDPFPRIVEAGDAGFTSYVRPGPVEDEAGFWERTGAVLAVLHAAGVTDLHGENVIAGPRVAVPVDLECWGAADQPWHTDPSAHLSESVLSTGLFPGWYGVPGPLGVETCGLFGERGRTSGTWVDSWEGLGGDTIDLVRRLGRIEAASNVARRADGSAVAPDLHRLLRGFDVARDRVDVGALLRALDSASPRVLVRSTQVYASKLYELGAPVLLADADGFARAAADLPEVASWKRDWFAPVADEVNAAEAAALAAFDVPLFRAERCDLVSAEGARIPSALPASAADRLRRRAGVATAGLQHEVITLAVEQSVGRQLVTGRRRLGPAQGSPLDLARTVGRHLRDQALPFGSTSGWLDIDKNPLVAIARPFTGLSDVYNGAEGIALAFAALHALDPDGGWNESARAALWAPLPDDDESRAMSWPTGPAGQVYARWYCGRLLGDESLVDEGVRRVLDLVPEVLAGPAWSGADLDLMTHAGGWVRVTAALAEATRRDDVTAAAVALTRRYHEAVARAWDDPADGRLLRYIGFAHRGTGVAFALGSAGRITGHAEAVALAQRMTLAEEERVAGRDGVGAALAGSGGAMRPRLGWCWGGAGWLLSRTEPVLAEVTDPMHVRRTIEHLASSRGDDDRDHLCCGAAGDVDALVTHRSHTADLGARIDGTIDEIVDRWRRRIEGDEPFHFHDGVSFRAPSLFGGFAGVAWSLCRLAEPGAIPDVLAVG